jgi:hypothetical protein
MTYQQTADEANLPRAVHELFPTLSEEERNRAVANFRRYVEIAIRISEQSSLKDAFDSSGETTTMKERSNSFLKK